MSRRRSRRENGRAHGTPGERTGEQTVLPERETGEQTALAAMSGDKRAWRGRGRKTVTSLDEGNTARQDPTKSGCEERKKENKRRKGGRRLLIRISVTPVNDIHNFPAFLPFVPHSFLPHSERLLTTVELVVYAPLCCTKFHRALLAQWLRTNSSVLTLEPYMHLQFDSR